MKKIILIIAIGAYCKTGYTLPKDMDVIKMINEKSIVVKSLNNMGIRTFKTAKELKKEAEEDQKTKIWVEGKSLKECMGKEKLLNNNTVQCHNGYFKEAD